MNSYSLDYIDDLYVQYVRDPNSVSDTWRKYFEQFLVVGGSRDSEPANASANSKVATSNRRGSTGNEQTDQALWLARIQDRVNNLVREYRVRGHLVADLDPLGLERPDSPNLNPESYGLSDDDLDRPFDSTALEDVMGETIHSFLDRLRNTYCRSIGAQFMHIDRRSIRDWLQRRMESAENRLDMSHERQRRIYARLVDASIFEEFVRRKFVGAKTFSLEGAESLIPMLDLALEKAGQHGVNEVVMGMAHRGRLNVMANILKKRAMNIFWSFDDPNPEMKPRWW